MKSITPILPNKFMIITKQKALLVMTGLLLCLLTNAQTTWDLSGNTGTNPPADFLGTTDSVPIVFKTKNVEKMRLNVNGSLVLKTVNGAGITAAFTDDNYFSAWVSINSQSANPSTGSGYQFRINDVKKSQLFYNPAAFSYGTVLDGITGNSDILSREGDVYLSTVTYRSNGLIVKNNTGYVGIGTTSPQYKLDVNGTARVIDRLIVGNDSYAFPTGDYRLSVKDGIITERLKIRLRASWPDYVFDNNYKLCPLAEVEQFIKTNNHLPGMPPAEKVKQEGIEIGEMNVKLLQKIEELTLYLIEVNKQIKSLQKQVNTVYPTR